MLGTLFGVGVWQNGFAKLAGTTSSKVATPVGAISTRQVARKTTRREKSATGGARRQRFVQVPATLNGTASALPSTPSTALSTSSALNPDALQAQRQEQRVQSIRSFLEAHSLSDKQMQSAIVEQLLAQEAARRELQAQGRQLFPVLGRKGMPPASELRTNQQLESYDKAVQAFQEKRRQSAATLEEKTGFSKNPRLRALLTVMGLIGEGPPILPL